MRYVLSDLDGVLVDSGAEVERIWREWAAERGIDPDLVARESHGVPARGVLALVAPELNTPEEIDRIERRHAATGGRAVPGAAELLARADAVVTSCSPELARRRFEAAGLTAPAVLITSDLTERGKPHPDPYLAGAAALGADPGRLRGHRGRPGRDPGRARRRHDRVGGDHDARARGARGGRPRATRRR